MYICTNVYIGAVVHTKMCYSAHAFYSCTQYSGEVGRCVIHSTFFFKMCTILHVKLLTGSDNEKVNDEMERISDWDRMEKIHRLRLFSYFIFVILKKPVSTYESIVI